MKKLTIASAILTVLAAPAALANQGGGTIQFKGAIVDGACSIEGQNSAQTVNLGQISATALESGNANQRTNFDIKLVGCDTTTAKAATVTFTGPMVSGKKDQLALNSATAKGAAISLFADNDTSKPIELGTPVSFSPLQEGNNTLSFSAQVVKVSDAAKVTAGAFEATAQFTMNYQ